MICECIFLNTKNPDIVSDYPLTMAAVSHLKNEKEAKKREDGHAYQIIIFIFRCGAGSREPVCVKTFIEVLGSCHIELEPKEPGWITQEDGMIERELLISTTLAP